MRPEMIETLIEPTFLNITGKGKESGLQFCCRSYDESNKIKYLPLLFT